MHTRENCIAQIVDKSILVYAHPGEETKEIFWLSHHRALYIQHIECIVVILTCHDLAYEEIAFLSAGLCFRLKFTIMSTLFQIAFTSITYAKQMHG